MGREQRSKGRAARHRVSLVVDYQGPEDLCYDYTQNLSSGGAFVRTNRNMKIGDEIDLCLSFPRLLKPLRLQGVVRWVREESDEDMGVGIEFTSFDGYVREQLEEVLIKIQIGDSNYVQPPIRVLLVEDNPHVAKLIREGLSSERFSSSLVECTWVSGGREALGQLESQSFDVMVVDCNFAFMNGATLITELRKREFFKSLPVVALSCGGEEEKQEALNAGADFFISRPLRLSAFFETLERLLGRERFKK